MENAQSISIKSIPNARELGGYITADGKSVKRGLLLRSAKLNDISDEDKSVLINNFRVQDIIDFRMEMEIAGFEDAPFDGARYHWLDVIEMPGLEMYDGEMPDIKPGDVIQAVELIEMSGMLQDDMYVGFLEGEKGKKAYGGFLRILLESDPDAIGRVSEMDTLEGRRGGKVIATFFNVQTMMMFGILCEHKDASSVGDAVATLHAAFLDVQFPMVFGILLGDRGSEFSDPTAIEAFGTKVFYCDAGKPGQKGCIERNHHEMRRILVKGVSFDNLTQKDVNLVLSHVNSYHRLELGGMSAFEMMRFCYGEEFVASARELGLVEVPAEKVNLTPALIPDIAEQVIARARKLVDEEEAARRAVEELRRKRGW